MKKLYFSVLILLSLLFIAPNAYAQGYESWNNVNNGLNVFSRVVGIGGTLMRQTSDYNRQTAQQNNYNNVNQNQAPNIVIVPVSDYEADLYDGNSGRFLLRAPVVWPEQVID